jgi:hypothetical protein
MNNSLFDPQNRYEYTKYKMEVSNKGIRGVCAYGTTTNIDYTTTDDVLFVGLQFGLKNQVDGDTIHLEVHHPVAGLLKRFASDWQIFEDTQIQINEEAVFPAKIPAGLIIRFVYNSTGAVDVIAKLNLRLHKVLV